MPEDWKSQYEDLAKRNQELQGDLSKLRTERGEAIAENAKLINRLQEEETTCGILLRTVENLSEALKNEMS